MSGLVYVVTQHEFDGSGKPKVLGVFSEHEFAERLCCLLMDCHASGEYVAHEVRLNELPEIER